MFHVLAMTSSTDTEREIVIAPVVPVRQTALRRFCAEFTDADALHIVMVRLGVLPHLRYIEFVSVDMLAKDGIDLDVATRVVEAAQKLRGVGLHFKYGQRVAAVPVQPADEPSCCCIVS